MPVTDGPAGIRRTAFLFSDRLRCTVDRDNEAVGEGNSPARAPMPLPPIHLLMLWTSSAEADPGHNWLRGRGCPLTQSDATG